MSVPAVYTSVHGKLVKISSFPGSQMQIDTPLLQNGTSDAMAMETMDSEATLLAESFQFSPRSGKFEPRGDRVTHTLGNGTDIRLLALAKVTDSRTGLKIPCLVVEQRVWEKYNVPVSAAGDGAGISKISKYRSRVSVVFLLLRKKTFLLRGFFTLGYSLKSTKLFLGNGPTLCWEHQRSVYFTRAFGSSNQTKVSVDDVKLDEDLSKPSKSLKWFGVVSGDAVAMGTEQSSNHEHSAGKMLLNLGHRWTVVKLPVHKTEERNVPIAEEIAPMPHEYSNIVNCLHFCQGSVSQLGSSFFRNSDRSVDKGSSLVLAATNQSQLVEACGGMVRRVCSITFNDACKIAIATVTGGEELILVQSAGGRVCAVWRKTFEVAREWTGFYTVLVDDFLFSGSEQLLLLGDGADAPQKRFHLTDLGMCNWSSEENGNTITDGPPVCAGNLQSAVQALESQVQTGMAALRSLESQCALKAQLIKQSQDALFKMAERTPPLPSHDTSLTCLCDLSGEDNTDVVGEETPSTDEDTTLECLSTWQRVADDRWIIGAEVANTTDRAISDVCISLIPASTPQTSLHSSTSTCNFKSVVSSAVASDHGEPMAKRIKLDQDSRTAVLESRAKTTVVGVTGVPEFVSEPVVTCTVVLNWREPFVRNHNDVVTAEENKARPGVDKDGFVDRRRACGTASLQACDVASGKLLINPLDRKKSDSERRHDIQALDALQLATPLLLTSNHSNLQCVKCTLKGPMGFQDVTMHDGMISAAGALGTTRVKIVSRDGPNKMAINVWSRNQSDLLLFCQHLYQQLPDDVIIKPLPPANQIWSAMGTTMATIDKELKHTSSKMQQLLATSSLSIVQGHDAKATTSNGANAGPSGEDKLKQVRGDFEGERRKWCNSDARLEVCASDKAHVLRQELLDLRINTDTDASNLASVFSVAK
ncbi:Fanconi anemia group B protein-like [Patiria miniata]|uniref:Uncharacterized protein n=1 Tax=Patiria miniata TaxID=46514 RepID=A0A913ZWY1_PATMI|nr:Fanconi anemia group B protein-like [Patiria miniata]